MIPLLSWQDTEVWLTEPNLEKLEYIKIVEVIVNRDGNSKKGQTGKYQITKRQKTIVHYTLHKILKQ
jgi:hypothetical protein